MCPAVVSKTTRSTDPRLMGEPVLYSCGRLAAAGSELIPLAVHFRLGQRRRRADTAGRYRVLDKAWYGRGPSGGLRWLFLSPRLGRTAWLP
jgi:hypothetical protein